MSFFDAFKPKWQNSNPAKRIEAIAELDDLSSQDIVERVALSDDNVEVKLAAIKRLAIIKTLQEISKNDKDSSVRRLAETRAFEEIVKKLKGYSSPDLDDEIRGYIEAVKDTRYAEDVLKATNNLALKHELAYKLFTNMKPFAEKLKPLVDTGLDYLKLGQTTAHLSGGERARLRLSITLARAKAPNTLFLFDEPARGLHQKDIQQLLGLIHGLCNAGHTVIAIEHAQDFVNTADYVVELKRG